ncbi:MAG TPA: hypothetical protein VK897_25100 [Anaerolineales bacterium]|nr:hypothetical protein [Anaerolineales bacterium]
MFRLVYQAMLRSNHDRAIAVAMASGARRSVRRVNEREAAADTCGNRAERAYFQRRLDEILGHIM